MSRTQTVLKLIESSNLHYLLAYSKIIKEKFINLQIKEEIIRPTKGTTVPRFYN